MRKSYIYKTIGNDLVYVNNIGNEYLLTEAVSPFGDGTYDIIVAFPMDKSVGDLEFGLFDAVDDPKWFCGACYVKDYMSGKSKELLKACQDYLDEEAKRKDEIEVFYTGGGIWLSAARAENNYYYIVSSEDEDGLLYFDHEDEDQDTDFPCQNCVWGKGVDEMLASERAIHTALVTALHEQMC